MDLKDIARQNEYLRDNALQNEYPRDNARQNKSLMEMLVRRNLCRDCI